MFTLHFIVNVPILLLDNESVFVTGSNDCLGDWDPNGALLLLKDSDGYLFFSNVVVGKGSNRRSFFF